jgi:hypothetical protein
MIQPNQSLTPEPSIVDGKNYFSSENDGCQRFSRVASLQFWRQVCGHISSLLSMLARPGNNYVVDKVYRRERHALWQSVHYDQFLWVEEGRQH